MDFTSDLFPILCQRDRFLEFAGGDGDGGGADGGLGVFGNRYGETVCCLSDSEVSVVARCYVPLCLVSLYRKRKSLSCSRNLRVVLARSYSENWLIRVYEVVSRL